MLKNSKFAALVLMSAIATSPAFADNKSAAMVNGVSIPQDRVDFRVKVVTAQGQADNPELRKAIREDLINIEIMSQEAVKKNLDKQPDVLQQLELAKQSVLVGAFVQDYIKSHPISDADITQEYNHLKSTAGNKEYKVRHILVEKESDAKSIAAKLKKGGDFDKLAKINTKDAGSKEHGGDLGWIPVGSIPTAFVKPFGDALMALSKGQLSEPVKSQFGWHVIKLDDVRDLKIPPLNEVKQQLAQRMQQQSVQKLVAELRTKAKIE
jgi:peptidyl-prolyl cis-trans isomerase C